MHYLKLDFIVAIFFLLRILNQIKSEHKQVKTLQGSQHCQAVLCKEGEKESILQGQKSQTVSALLSGCYGLGYKVKMVLKKGIIVDEEKTNRETKRLKCLIRTADAADAAAAVFSQSDSLLN